MQDPIRVRENRKGNNPQRISESLTGVMVKGTAYNGDVRMLDLYPAVPHNAKMAGQMADGLLPVDG